MHIMFLVEGVLLHMLVKDLQSCLVANRIHVIDNRHDFLVTGGKVCEKNGSN
jgi:hypothetical protein